MQHRNTILRYVARNNQALKPGYIQLSVRPYMVIYILYTTSILYDLFEDIGGNKENQTNLPAICVQKKRLKDTTDVGTCTRAQ